MHIYLSLFFFSFGAISSLHLIPSVDIRLGKIEGFVDKSITGRTFFSFNGIPYAEPPIGKNRFKEPNPPKPWTGILKANTHYECLQFKSFSHTNKDQNSVTGTEDCLFVNVHTPNLEGNMDVFVYIHGGAFIIGSGGMMVQPHILMDRDVVVVTLNYRLGPLGFLSTEDGVLPGNNGIKDQILALKWVKEYIHHFGGNPDSITISGTSAGGASAHLLTLSPKSKGLFHKAISSSGCMLNPWTLMKNPLNVTKKLASLLGCETENSKQMVDCLTDRTGKQIVATVPHFHAWQSSPLCPFGPVVDEWSEDAVLPEHPYKLLKEKKIHDIPWILGQMAHEGHCNGFDFYSEKTLEYLDEHWNVLMPHILHYNYTVEPSNLELVSEILRKEYLGEDPPSMKNLNKLLTLFGDRLFGADFDNCLRLHSSAIKSPVYFYLFNYRGAHSFTEMTTLTNEDFGAAHGDDLMYITSSLSDSLSTESDRAMTKLIVDMYLTFAKDGKPKINNGNWTPVSKTREDPINYLKINSPSSLVNEKISEIGNCRFWNSLPFEENGNLIKLMK